MEALLAHQTRMLIPAALGSSILLLINAGLLRYVFRFDHEVQRESESLMVCPRAEASASSRAFSRC